MNVFSVCVAKIKKHYSVFGAYLFLAWAAIMIVGVLSACVLFKISPNQSFGYLHHWDGGWYLKIVKNGYPDLRVATPDPNGRNGAVAFFPLYPLLILIVSALTFISAALAGLLISWTSFLVAIQLLVYLLEKEWKLDKSASRAAVALLVLNPFSVFFGMVYTESLFLAISTLAFIFLSRKNYLLAALAAGLASGLRVTGIIVGVVVVLVYIMSEEHSLVRALTKIRTYGIAALSVSGFAAFTTFLYLRTGDALAFIRVQSGFNRHFNLSGFVADFHTIIVKFGTHAIWPYTLSAAVLIVPLGSGTFTSINRYNMIFVGLYVSVMNFIKSYKLRMLTIAASGLVMLGFVVLMCDPVRPMIG